MEPFQQEWIEIAETMRIKLRQYAALIPAMKPEEVKMFVETLQAGIWLEQHARTLDEKIKREALPFDINPPGG